MGTAIVHLHSTFSDGMSPVEEILDEVETNSDVDVIGITDHDDCRSFAAAMDWQEGHPGSRIQPIWGAEITVFGFKHVLAFKMRPPFPTTVPKKFLSLGKAVGQLNATGCYVVAPHVDAPVVGIGRSRLARMGQKLGLFGYELLTPYFTPPGSVPELRSIGDQRNLLALGGPDAHFIEDLYRIVLHFPGHSAEEFERSWLEGMVAPELGWEGPKKTWRQRVQQQRRSLIEHPAKQVRAWVRNRMDAQS